MLGKRDVSGISLENTSHDFSYVVFVGPLNFRVHQGALPTAYQALESAPAARV